MSPRGQRKTELSLARTLLLGAVSLPPSQPRLLCPKQKGKIPHSLSTPPAPYFRVCGRIFFPSRWSARALSMSSCTSSAWGHRGVKSAWPTGIMPTPSGCLPYLHLVAVKEVNVRLVLV